MRFKPLTQVPDEYTRKNFDDLSRAIGSEALLRSNFKHYEVELTGAQSDYRMKHSLGFVPKDVLVTKSQGPGTVTFNHDDFTTTDISITTTNTVKLRFFLGAYS